MSTHLPVGLFDSGVGGLTVVEAIRSRLPQLDLCYVADSAYAPYGGKAEELVRERAMVITRFLMEQGVGAVVVACNTATAIAVETLRRTFDIPIIAMEPAVKPAVAATRSGVIGVLATAGTLESERYRQLLARHGSQMKVLGRVCHHWVELVESGELDTDLARRQVAEEVVPLLDAGADTLVLGCTHFPYLSDLIREVAGPTVTLIDPAPAVAAHLANQLGADWGGQGQLRLWSSRREKKESLRLGRLLGLEADVSLLPW